MFTLRPWIKWSSEKIRVPESLRKSKWEDKAQLGVLVGYVENGYRVNVRHVQVVEGNTKLNCSEKTMIKKKEIWKIANL